MKKLFKFMGMGNSKSESEGIITPSFASAPKVTEDVGNYVLVSLDSAQGVLCMLEIYN